MMLVVVPGAAFLAQGAAGPGEIAPSAIEVIAGLGLGAYEVRQQLLRGVPFALGADVERARGTAVELRTLGIEAWAVDEDAWTRIPRTDVVKSFRLFPEGLELTTRPTAQIPVATHAVRWDDVQLLLPARSVQSTTTELTTSKRKVALNPMKMKAKISVDHSREESEERFVIVLARSPDVLARFNEHGMDYLGLGEQRGPVARANYDTLVALLKRGAGGARVDDRLEKLASRLSGAPTTASSRASSTGGLTKKVERTFAADNEGAVMNAARLLCVVERLRRG